MPLRSHLHCLPALYHLRLRSVLHGQGVYVTATSFEKANLSYSILVRRPCHLFPAQPARSHASRMLCRAGTATLHA
eukprot:2442646-Pleurochrysis_carterae.AAC.8